MRKKYLSAFCIILLIFSGACTRAPIADDPSSVPVAEETTAVSPGEEQPSAAPGVPLMTITVQEPDYSVGATIDRLDPTASGLGGPVIYLTSDADGAQRISFIRLPLPTGITAEQVQKVYLEICYKEGDVPTSAQTGVVTQRWTTQGATWDIMGGAVSFENASAAEEAGDGWYRFDVTATVQNWLNGAMENLGFALEYTDANLDTQIYPPNTDDDISKSPRLVVTYAPTEDTMAYGKYDFAEQAEGNCLSYALRDTDPIYLDQLLDDAAAFEDAIAQGNGVKYFSDLVVEYVQAHKDALGISGFRIISADEAIDTDTEYRIALRLGFHNRNGVDGIQAKDGDFDYHLRAQLRDGSWTEKFPRSQSPSRIVPGTNAENSLNQYPWSASYQIGNEKFQDYYDSDIVYFAVTKTTDDFTAHLSAQG